MLNFIVYESDSSMRESYIKIIKKFLYSVNDKYIVYEYDRCSIESQDECNSVSGVKIYLISLDTFEKDALAFARNIRRKGDINSPIILLSSKIDINLYENLNNVLFLDLILKDNRLAGNLLKSLNDAYKIITRNSVYTFSSFDEVYRIPYDEICYIRKNLKDDTVTIYTLEDSFLYYVTIKKLEEVLMHDPRFLKVHRSCIININNVSLYDKKENVILFHNGLELNLVARSFKSQLLTKLEDFNNVIK